MTSMSPQTPETCVLHFEVFNTSTPEYLFVRIAAVYRPYEYVRRYFHLPVFPFFDFRIFSLSNYRGCY